MQNALSLVHECQGARVSVARWAEQLTVVASETISRGQTILMIEGAETKTPSIFSVQIDDDTHIDLDDPALVETYPERYLWRFLNHHCRPNAYLRGRQLVAREHINIGDEVTFNYNSNEYDMANPFECLCSAHGAAAPRMIRGYRYLSETERNAIEPLAAPHVKRLAERND